MTPRRPRWTSEDWADWAVAVVCLAIIIGVIRWFLGA